MTRARLFLAAIALAFAALASGSSDAATCIAIYASDVPDDVAKLQPICLPVG